MLNSDNLSMETVENREPSSKEEERVNGEKDRKSYYCRHRRSYDNNNDEDDDSHHHHHHHRSKHGSYRQRERESSSSRHPVKTGLLSVKRCRNRNNRYRYRDGDREERNRRERGRDIDKDRGKERERESRREGELEQSNSHRSRSRSERRNSNRKREHRERSRDWEMTDWEFRDRDRDVRIYKEKDEEVEPEDDQERNQRTVFAYQICLKADKKDVYDFFSRDGKSLNVHSREILTEKVDQSGVASSISGSTVSPVLNGPGLSLATTPFICVRPGFTSLVAPVGQITLSPLAGLPGSGLAVLPIPAIESIGVPSECLLPKDMFDPTAESGPDFDLDIKDDVQDECSKFGAAKHIYVDKQVKWDTAGFVYLMFDSTQSAMCAQRMLHQKWFNGKMVEATYIGFARSTRLNFQTEYLCSSVSVSNILKGGFNASFCCSRFVLKPI